MYQNVPVIFDEKSINGHQYSNIIQGIRSAAAKSNIRISLLPDTHFTEKAAEQLPPIAVVTGSDMPFIRHAIATLRRHGKKALLSGSDSDPFGEDVFCVTPSRRVETQQMLNYLSNCGKEHIALVGFGKHSINDSFRYHAAMSAAAALGRPLSEKDAWLWHTDPKEIFDLFLDVCSQYDAAICPNDAIAICLLNACRRRGIEVPRDFFVASFGNMTIGRFYRPSITSMTMDNFNVGEQTFHLWRFLMTNENAWDNAFHVTVPSRILIRETTMNIPYDANLCRNASSGTPGEIAADRFYENETIATLVSIERCLLQRDHMDMSLVARLMDRQSYEQICDELFISSSTLRYRLNKIYADVGVRRRKEFEELLRTHLGSDNPFGEAVSTPDARAHAAEDVPQGYRK